VSYTYEYTYPKNREAAGYSGPVPLLIETETYAPGIMEVNDHRNLIRASLQRILGTSRGERVMQPEFGHSLKRILFEPLDEIIIEDLKREIYSIVSTQEPRIEVRDVYFDLDYDNHTIAIAVSFYYRRSGVEDYFNFYIRG
jgi:phage baseplate assembly protein W